MGIPRAAATVATALALASLTGACSDSAENAVAFCDAITDSSLGGAVTTIDLQDQVSLASAVAELETIASVAPSDIADDADLVADVFAEVLDVLANNDVGTRDDALRDLQPRLNEVAQPATRLQEYATETCALGFEGPEEPTPTPTPLDIEN